MRMLSVGIIQFTQKQLMTASKLIAAPAPTLLETTKEQLFVENIHV